MNVKDVDKSSNPASGINMIIIATRRYSFLYSVTHLKHFLSHDIHGNGSVFAELSMGQNLCGRGKATKNTGSVKMANIGVENTDEKTMMARMTGDNTTFS